MRPGRRRLRSATVIRVKVKDALGRWGEQRAEAYLLGQGYELVERNWRCGAGELDLVLTDGPAIVFCEVKTRSSLAFGDPVEAVVGAKAERLRRLAGRWLTEHPGSWPDIRIDVVGVLRPRQGPVQIRHLKAVV